MTSQINLGIDKTLSLYKKVILIRRAETAIAQYYLSNKIFSFVHFYVGQEGIAAGVSEELNLSDRVYGNHRSHGHYLAKGGDLFRMYSEMLGKATGCCSGRGGSMHMLDRSVGFMGTTPILGSIAPIATGSALQQKLDETGDVTVVFIGDGAAEEGIFFESLNFSSALGLPILFVIEDNLYSVNSPHTDRKHPDFNYQNIAKGIGLPYLKVDGNDVLEVNASAREALSWVRTKRQPYLLHAVAYRHMAHSSPLMDDHLGYRMEDHLSQREKSDVLARLENYIAEYHDSSAIHTIQEEVSQLVELSLQKAILAPEPKISEIELGAIC